MKRFILILSFAVLFTSWLHAEHCFLAKEKDNIIRQNGSCNKRYAPCSTFKIALSLIGYDAGILIDKKHPAWPFQQGYPDFLDQWKQTHTPKGWIKNSCIWYSQVLTKKLGMEKLQSYVTKLNYGNMDLSGDKGQNNGLTNSWLSSSLEISGQEQIDFLEKFLAHQIPISQHAHTMTKNLLFLENLSNGWKLYGKTGNGFLLNSDKTEKLKIQHGWFIGWIEKGDRIIVFANHITDDKEKKTFASLRAKTDAKEKLNNIILNDVV